MIGLLGLLCLAGLAQSSRNPEKTTARLGVIAGALLVVGAAVFAIRGDFFQPSGMDDDGSAACGMARGC